MLESWLEFHRATLLLKCDGVDSKQVQPSGRWNPKLSRGFGVGLCAQRRAVLGSLKDDDSPWVSMAGPSPRWGVSCPVCLLGQRGLPPAPLAALSSTAL